MTFAAKPNTASTTCNIVEPKTGQIEVDATLTHPGLLVLSNQFDPGWSVDVTTAGTRSQRDIVRTNGVMQGVFLPEGQHHLVFKYMPRGFRAAASISIAGWVSFLMLGLWTAAKRPKRR